MISLEKIKNTLRDEDVEGYIKIHGAPEDEYDSEAQEIYHALKDVAFSSDINGIIAALVLTWKKSFNLDENEIEKRLPYLRNVAQKLS